MPNLVISSL